jgi:hypothetical protein
MLDKFKEEVDREGKVTIRNRQAGRVRAKAYYQRLAM